ncbi:glycosyltransferase, partial [candidate division KSB3 bacterium]|nr:glycosyltransferase [candidate division KSB3 bacterium]
DDDSTELTKAITRLAANPEATRKMGQAARVHVRENFSIEHHVESVMDLYDRLITN